MKEFLAGPLSLSSLSSLLPRHYDLHSAAKAADRPTAARVDIRGHQQRPQFSPEEIDIAAGCPLQMRTRLRDSALWHCAEINEMLCRVEEGKS